MKKSNILIVDDNDSLCRSMALVLGHKGYTVTTANDGPEAIKKVKETAFDMIFMDIKMPVMDGVEAYKKIKKINPKTAVVMMTAYSVEDLIQEALSAGAYSIIYKPIDFDRIITLIDGARRTKEGTLIMVADDDPGTRLIFKQILSYRDCKVIIATSGKEAIAKARAQDFDIIFIEAMLPAISGLETCLAIKEIRPKAIVIIMTADPKKTVDLVEEALSNCVYACLYKPFKIEEVLKLIDKVMQKKRKSSQ